jgi:hypothetical protein
VHVHKLEFLFERLAADVDPVDVDRTVLCKDLLGVVGLVWEIVSTASYPLALDSQLNATSAPSSFKYATFSSLPALEMTFKPSALAS